jgi:hypothetical protein
MYPYYSLHQMPISLFKFFSGAQPQTVGNYSYAKKHHHCVMSVVCATLIFFMVILHLHRPNMILRDLQHDTERFTTWYWEIYNMILRNLQHDTERFTIWYWEIYNMILRDLQHDTERFTTWYWEIYNNTVFIIYNFNASIHEQLWLFN